MSSRYKIVEITCCIETINLVLTPEKSAPGLSCKSTAQSRPTVHVSEVSCMLCKGSRVNKNIEIEYHHSLRSVPK